MASANRVRRPFAGHPAPGCTPGEIRPRSVGGRRGTVQEIGIASSVDGSFTLRERDTIVTVQTAYRLSPAFEPTGPLTDRGRQ